MNADFYANIGDHEIKIYHEEYKASEKADYIKAVKAFRRNNPKVHGPAFDRQLEIIRRQYKF